MWLNKVAAGFSSPQGLTLPVAPAVGIDSELHGLALTLRFGGVAWPETEGCNYLGSTYMHTHILKYTSLQDISSCQWLFFMLCIVFTTPPLKFSVFTNTQFMIYFIGLYHALS